MTRMGLEDAQDFAAPARPKCFNRADFPGGWRPGCPSWAGGGNAHRMDRNPSAGEPWEACEGCAQKIKAESLEGPIEARQEAR